MTESTHPYRRELYVMSVETPLVAVTMSPSESKTNVSTGSGSGDGRTMESTRPKTSYRYRINCKRRFFTVAGDPSAVYVVDTVLLPGSV
jgi:hypothetical protein